ncbi:hypothetical protein CFT13S00388_08015 [Campylobacter fetus subsp. testudinum]|uniref:hypothetical protein n=1 Tax=Campylobacter fetus TaxID=196 RepID=UPI000818AA72|nr:hypothetical protein [Campylobacter fetus]OCR86691.1 hypothetical protein CFT13S00388_08015 [Campylobacter fetus subsp. testudinum]
MEINELIEYLNTSVRPQLATLSEAVNTAAASNAGVNTKVQNSLNIINSALSNVAADITLSDGSVVPNLKKLIEQAQSINNGMEVVTLENIARLQTKASQLIEEIKQNATNVANADTLGGKSATVLLGEADANATAITNRANDALKLEINNALKLKLSTATFEAEKAQFVLKSESGGSASSATLARNIVMKGML